jgi:hypothetical protein
MLSCNEEKLQDTNRQAQIARPGIYAFCVVCIKIQYDCHATVASGFMRALVTVICSIFRILSYS